MIMSKQKSIFLKEKSFSFKISKSSRSSNNNSFLIILIIIIINLFFTLVKGRNLSDNIDYNNDSNTAENEILKNYNSFMSNISSDSRYKFYCDDGCALCVENRCQVCIKDHSFNLVSIDNENNRIIKCTNNSIDNCYTQLEKSCVVCNSGFVMTRDFKQCLDCTEAFPNCLTCGNNLCNTCELNYELTYVYVNNNTNYNNNHDILLENSYGTYCYDCFSKYSSCSNCNLKSESTVTNTCNNICSDNDTYSVNKNKCVNNSGNNSCSSDQEGNSGYIQLGGTCFSVAFFIILMFGIGMIFIIVCFFIFLAILRVISRREAALKNAEKKNSEYMIKDDHCKRCSICNVNLIARANCKFYSKDDLHTVVDKGLNKDQGEEINIDSQTNRFKYDNNNNAINIESIDLQTKNDIEKDAKVLYCGGYICKECQSRFEENLSLGIYKRCAYCNKYIIGYFDNLDINSSRHSNREKQININSDKLDALNANNNNNSNKNIIVNSDEKIEAKLTDSTKKVFKETKGLNINNNSNNSYSKENVLCFICQEYNPETVIPCKNKPQHKVHKNCFAKLLDQNIFSCPICRTSFGFEDEVYINKEYLSKELIRNQGIVNNNNNVNNNINTLNNNYNTNSNIINNNSNNNSGNNNIRDNDDNGNRNITFDRNIEI